MCLVFSKGINLKYRTNCLIDKGVNFNSSKGAKKLSKKWQCKHSQLLQVTTKGRLKKQLYLRNMSLSLKVSEGDASIYH